MPFFPLFPADVEECVCLVICRAAEWFVDARGRQGKPPAVMMLRHGNEPAQGRHKVNRVGGEDP